MNSVTHNYTLVRDCFQKFFSESCSSSQSQQLIEWRPLNSAAGEGEGTALSEPSEQPAEGSASVPAPICLHCGAALQTL